MVGRRKNPYAALEKRIGHRFKRRDLLEAALTHRSYRFENKGVEEDNQRLEFLGDAVLGLLTAACFYRQFEDEAEGFLTSLRSQTASGKALANLAENIGLGGFMRIGKGEEASGGRKRASNLADALEAVVGAAYVDGGTKAAERVFKQIFHPWIERLTGDVWADNPKGRLQEYCQRRWRKSPSYRTLKREGPEHSRRFTVEVSVGGKKYGRGRASNKQEAEIRAAEKTLAKLGVG